MYKEFSLKLKECSEALINWSRIHYPNNRAVIDKLKACLTEFSNNTEVENLEEEDCIQAQIDELWCKEKVYWHQRPQVN